MPKDKLIKEIAIAGLKQIEKMGGEMLGGAHIPIPDPPPTAQKHQPVQQTNTNAAETTKSSPSKKGIFSRNYSTSTVSSAPASTFTPQETAYAKGYAKINWSANATKTEWPSPGDVNWEGDKYTHLGDVDPETLRNQFAGDKANNFKGGMISNFVDSVFGKGLKGGFLDRFSNKVKENINSHMDLVLLFVTKRNGQGNIPSKSANFLSSLYLPVISFLITMKVIKDYVKDARETLFFWETNFKDLKTRGADAQKEIKGLENEISYCSAKITSHINSGTRTAEAILELTAQMNDCKAKKEVKEKELSGIESEQSNLVQKLHTLHKEVSQLTKHAEKLESNAGLLFKVERFLNVPDALAIASSEYVATNKELHSKTDFTKVVELDINSLASGASQLSTNVKELKREIETIHSQIGRKQSKLQDTQDLLKQATDVMEHKQKTLVEKKEEVKKAEAPHQNALKDMWTSWVPGGKRTTKTSESNNESEDKPKGPGKG